MVIIYVFIEKLKKMSHDYPQNTHLMWAADLETEVNATNELFLLTYSKCEHTCTHWWGYGDTQRVLHEDYLAFHSHNAENASYM